MSEKGYMIYDFFLPGLVLHTIETKNSSALLKWAREIVENNYRTVNMLGCHDGIPVLDLKGKEVEGQYMNGLLEDEQIDWLIDIVLKRGGKIKSLFDPSGKKISYYQVNATYYSALGEDPQKLLIARAIQLFMPGIPQIWYLDLFAGKNDYQAIKKQGSGGHKEINRTNLSRLEVESTLKLDLVQKQLEMIKLRNMSKAFDGKVQFEECSSHEIRILWSHQTEKVSLRANLNTLDFVIQKLQ
jgi:sucrose phosphorylase